MILGSVFAGAGCDPAAMGSAVLVVVKETLTWRAGGFLLAAGVRWRPDARVYTAAEVPALDAVSSITAAAMTAVAAGLGPSAAVLMATAV